MACTFEGKMRTKQDVQLELLQEIDNICSKNGLKYFLIGKNSLNAYLNHTIKNGPLMVAVAMTHGDIDRFCEIVEKEFTPDRYVEGIFNNPDFNPFYVVYGNRNTTDFHMINVNKNIHHGIRIRIYPILKASTLDGEKIVGWNRLLSKERKFRKFINRRIDNEKFWYIKTGISAMRGAYKLIGGSNRYYKQVKSNTFIDKWKDIQNYGTVRISKKEIPAELLKKTMKYEVDGIELRLPKNPDLYFAETYGEDFREKIIKPKAQRVRVIVDTEVGYEQIMEETKDILYEARKTHEEIQWERRKFKKEKRTVANVWNLVQMTKKQIEFREYFKDNIDRLMAMDLNDEEQFEEVYQELKPVIKTLRKYSKSGMTFSIDPKTDAFIEEFLEISNRPGLLKKMKKLQKKEIFVE